MWLQDLQIYLVLTSGEVKVEHVCSLQMQGRYRLITNLLWSVDDSRVVTKLQRADDGGGQREQEITCHLLFLM